MNSLSTICTKERGENMDTQSQQSKKFSKGGDPSHLAVMR